MAAERWVGMNVTVTCKRFELGRNGGLVPVDESAGKGLPVGTVLHWGGNMGWAERDFCILFAEEHETYGGHYHCFDMDEPEKNAMLHRVEFSDIKREDDPNVWHRQHFFLTDRICTPEEVAVFNAQHIAQKAAANDAKAKAEAETARLTEIGKRLWKELGFDGAKHLIVAEHEVDDSDIQTDYFASHTSETVVLARSEHGKDLFSELRKAALLIPETRHLGPGCDEWKVMLKAHADTGRTWSGRLTDADGRETWPTEAEARAVLNAALAEDDAQNKAVPFVPFCPRVPYGADVEMESVENREKYSGGQGYYLGRNRHSGWQVRKVGVGNNPAGWYLVALAKRSDHLTAKPRAQTPAAAPTPAEPQAGAVATVTENEDKNGVEIRFPSRPSESVLSELKANGWRWSRFAGCWYNKRSDETKAFAARIAAGG